LRGVRVYPDATPSPETTVERECEGESKHEYGGQVGGCEWGEEGDAEDD
jgi:hypothetical protein